MLSLLRLERKQKIIQFQIRIFLFLSNSFGIETINTFTHSLVQFPRTPYPIPDQNGQGVYPFPDQLTAPKPYPMGRHIPIWLI